MKWIGFVFFIIGIIWTYMWRHDPVEGQFMRPAGFLIAAFGFFCFFEGLKNEIINALKDQKDDHLQNQHKE